ncbi:hypothetical protein N431DRAFT_561962 [Stipitochalara longipes BDJ]|nr:hypothetical protein N431DRAFT_561962 [Stipitochalara longipes BDJ]
MQTGTISKGKGVSRCRNGKLQACEPCRTSKLACDHTQPTCLRCARRSMSISCTYLQSPLRRERSIHHLPGNKPRPDSIHDSAAITSSREVRHSIPRQADLSIDGWLEYPDEHEMLLWNEPSQDENHPSSADISFQGQPGQPGHNANTFDGNTFNNNSSLHLLSRGSGICPRIGHGLKEPKEGTPQPRCMKVLLSLPHRQHFRDLINRFACAVYPIAPILHALTIHSMHKNVCELVNSWSRETESLPSLHSDSNFRPSVFVVSDGKTCSLGSFDALNFDTNDVSWDVIATLFAVYGLAGLSLTEWDPMWSSEEHLGRKTFAVTMLTCVDEFLSFGKSTDARPTTWTRHTSLIVASVASGLTQHGTKTFSKILGHSQRVNLEMSRRLFACVFTLDKLLSTKFQHPPALGLSYVAFDMPFGLPDEQLFSDDGESRQLGNENSPPRDKISLSPSAYLRGCMLSSQIRDKILAVSWGIKRACYIDQYNQLKQALLSAQGSLPKSIKFLDEKMDLSPAALMQRSLVYLEFKHSELLLARIAPAGSIQRSHWIKAAYEMLDCVLGIWAKRDLLVDFQWQFELVIVCYGFPSVETLTAELVAETPSEQSSSDSITLLPLSDMVQKLFLFLSMIEWVKPSNGSYDVCQLMRGKLKSALNSVLEFPKAAATVPINEYDFLLTGVSEISSDYGEDISSSTVSLWPISSGLEWDNENYTI